MQRLTITHQLASVLEELISRPAKAEGLSVTEALLMAQLAKHPGATCAELAWQLVRDRGNTQRTLASLERRGLVLCSRHPGDPRDVAWMLSERGGAVWGIVENRIVLEELELERSVPDLRECFDRLRHAVLRLDALKAPRRSSHGDYSRPAPRSDDGSADAAN